MATKTTVHFMEAFGVSVLIAWVLFVCHGRTVTTKDYGW